MKVALTVWDGRISPVFDVCREALVLTIDRSTVVLSVSEAVDRADGLRKIRRLVDLGVETLICGAISEPLHQELTSRQVRVIGFVAGEVEEVVSAFIADQLPDPSLAMPGCYGRQHGLSRRPGQGRGRGRRRGGQGLGRPGR